MHEVNQPISDVLARTAVDELLLLGYTIDGDDMDPPNESAAWCALAAERLAGAAGKPKRQPQMVLANYWAVIAKSGEGVLFSEPKDAQWTHTGQGKGSDGFGVPTIGAAFRDAYADQDLQLVTVQVIQTVCPAPADAQQETGIAITEFLVSHALSELVALGYTIEGDNLYPPKDSPEWDALLAARTKAKPEGGA